MGLKLDHIYTYMIDKDEQTNTDPIIVISELPRNGHEYGNNIPIYERRRVQLIFYYPKNYMGPEEGLEQKIKNVLRRYGFYCWSNSGHAMTPDSQNITNTLKFNFKKEVI